MKYKTWLMLDSQNYNTFEVSKTKMEEVRDFLTEEGIKVLSIFTKVPLVLCEIDEDDLNFIRLTCRFGKVSVFKGPLHSIKGEYKNSPGYSNTPTEYWKSPLEDIQ